MVSVTLPAEDVIPAAVNAASAALAVKAPQGYEVVLYEKVGMGWGNHANNPILQELPDPISRVTWDNYITMAPADMDAMKLNKMMGQEQQANVVKVSLGNRSLELPVLAQPGQARLDGDCSSRRRKASRAGQSLSPRNDPVI